MAAEEQASDASQDPSVFASQRSQRSMSEPAHYLPPERQQGVPMAVPLGIPMNGGSVQRMWEGGLFDCFEDPVLAAQTFCCPCVTFGQNLKMAGFGDCSTQGCVHFALTFGIFLACQLLALWTGSGFFRVLAFILLLVGAAYAAYYRVETRNRFNIHGSECGDYVFHTFCCWCALCQEGRTLQVNNVHNGIWAGRGNMATMVGQPISIAVVPPPPFEIDPRSSPLTRAYLATYTPPEARPKSRLNGSHAAGDSYSIPLVEMGTASSSTAPE